MYKLILIFLVVIVSGCSTVGEISNPQSISTDFVQLKGEGPIIKITPFYPKEAIELLVSGEVEIQFTIGVQGKPIEFKVLNSASPILEQAAIKQLKKNRYHPKLAGNLMIVKAIFNLTSWSN